MVEHTGYPREMVDLTAEFEADLGLDSIKLAQLVGEIRSSFALNIDQEDRKAFIASRTLADICDHLIQRFGVHDTSNNEPSLNIEVHEVALNVDKKSAFLTMPQSSVDERPTVENRIRDVVAVNQRHEKPARTSTATTQSTQIFQNSVPADRLKGLRKAAKANSFARQKEFLESLDSGFELSVDVAHDEPEVDTKRITQRYSMSMQRKPFEEQVAAPKFFGGAVVVGDNPIADALQSKLQRLNIPVLRLRSDESSQWVAKLESAWQTQPFPHLFLLTPHDAQARVGQDPHWWSNRAKVAVDAVFWLTQKWYQFVVEANALPDSSLVATPNLGGDFGFASKVDSTEGGVLTGLVKALIIECWMAGQRRLNFKLVDFGKNVTPVAAASSVFDELSYGSYDTEIGYGPEGRSVVRAKITNRGSRSRTRPERGDVWICTGGARGITSHVVRKLADRYGIKLVLVGPTRLVEFPREWLSFDGDKLRALKLEVMQRARTNPEQYGHTNPLKAWQNLEKAMEIRQTLLDLQASGHDAEYVSCDCSDVASVQAFVRRVEIEHGPIRGILHGAGVGQDSRFERKLPEKVRQCFAAKLDALLH